MKYFTLLMFILSVTTTSLLAQEPADGTPTATPEQEKSEVVKSENANKDTKPVVKKKATKIYTWIDEKGNRIYSDTPREGAEELKIQKSSEYTPTAVASPWQSSTPNKQQKPSYTTFSIISPANDTTIRNNLGAIQVAFDIRPKLMAGHQIVLLSNGTEISRSRTPLISLNNVDRGSHSYSAQIMTEKGEVVATSNSITVHLHRPTIRRAP